MNPIVAIEDMDKSLSQVIQSRREGKTPDPRHVAILLRASAALLMCSIEDRLPAHHVMKARLFAGAVVDEMSKEINRIESASKA